MFRVNTRQSLAASMILAGLFSQPLLAQPLSATTGNGATSDTMLNDIVVTAQKREESLQKVPLSITAFGGPQLQSRGITNVLDIQALTPGLQLTNANGEVIPFLRGIGNAANPIGNEPSVAVYVDGVYYSRLPSGFFSLADIQRVEVLKGPQGTLFGRNSTGGVIQIITPNPSHNAQLRGHVGYGSYNTFHGDAYVTIGLSDTMAADISVSGRRQGDGYGSNVSNRHRATYNDDFTVRSKLLVEPSDRTTILLTGAYSYALNSALGNTYPGTLQGYQSLPNDQPQPPLGFYDARSDIDNRNIAKAWTVSLKIQQDLEFGQFTSITAYLNDKEHQVVGGDYSERPIYRADLFGRVRQLTQEFQLASSSSGGLNWIAGLFYYNAFGTYNPLRFQGASFFPADVLGDSSLNAFDIFARQRARSYAGYAQASYEILPRFKLTGGIRYTSDKLRGSGHNDVTIDSGAFFIPGTVTTARDKTNKVTFKVAVDYQFADDILGYASFSRGYKSSNFNLLPFTTPANRPETLDAYEVGIKSELFDRKLRLNAALFWYDVSNPQVQLLNNGAITLSNAGSSRVKGAEFESTLVAAPGLTFTLGGTYLDAKYRDYVGAPSGPPVFVAPFGSLSPQLSIDASGNRTPMAPKFTGTVGAQYGFDTSIGDWKLALDYSYNDGFFWEPDNFLRQKSYSMINGQVQLQLSDNISIAVWGKNLADEKIAAFAATQEGPSGYPFVAAPPATYGVTIGFNFK